MNEDLEVAIERVEAAYGRGLDIIIHKSGSGMAHPVAASVLALAIVLLEAHFEVENRVDELRGEDQQ